MDQQQDTGRCGCDSCEARRLGRAVRTACAAKGRAVEDAWASIDVLIERLERSLAGARA